MSGRQLHGFCSLDSACPSISSSLCFMCVSKWGGKGRLPTSRGPHLLPDAPGPPVQGVVDLGIALTRQAQGKSEQGQAQGKSEQGQLDFTPYILLACFGGLGSLFVW